MRLTRWVLTASLMIGFVSTAAADTNATGPGKLMPGQKELLKNLIYGAHRKEDYKINIKRYAINASKPEALDYAFVVRHANGTDELIPLSALKNEHFERVVSGIELYLKATRRSNDTSDEINLSVSWHTRNQFEPDFP